jgi:hypothetical protein
MRHLEAYWEGESFDQETGCHHMAMAAWNCFTLLAYSVRGVGNDDRPGVEAPRPAGVHTIEVDGRAYDVISSIDVSNMQRKDG